MKRITTAVLALVVLATTAGTAAALPVGDAGPDGDVGPPGGLPDVVPDVVSGILDAVGTLVTGVLDAVLGGETTITRPIGGA